MRVPRSGKLGNRSRDSSERRRKSKSMILTYLVIEEVMTDINRARLARIKQEQAASISKRARPLGRK